MATQNRMILGLSLGMTLGLGAITLLTSGCVSYTNVPEPSSAPAFKHANSGASIKVIVASVERVVIRHPMKDSAGHYAVNLPAGTTPETANTIVSRLPDGAIVPFVGMSDSVPVYHIGRIWLRGSSGKVDVVYPLSSEVDAGVDGGVTVWVHGGDQPWYVERLQYWAPGTVPTPPIYVPIDGTGGVGSLNNKDTNGYTVPDPHQPQIEERPRESVKESAQPGTSEPEHDGSMYREVDN